MATEPKKTANMVVDGAYTTTTVTSNTDDLGSSDGIRRAVQANARAIRLLADHIDGIATDPVTGVRTEPGTAGPAPTQAPDPGFSTNPLTGVRTNLATGARTDSFGKTVV
jgi:hypothetical protein